jgi:hypothetical protein
MSTSPSWSYTVGPGRRCRGRLSGASAGPVRCANLLISSAKGAKAGAAGSRAGLAEARDAHDHQRGVVRPQDIRAEAPPFHSARDGSSLPARRTVRRDAAILTHRQGRTGWPRRAVVAGDLPRESQSYSGKGASICEAVAHSSVVGSEQQDRQEQTCRKTASSRAYARPTSSPARWECSCWCRVQE